MKKIFAGMFFRLFKGFELYVLIVAIMLSSAYVITRQIDEDGFVCISRTDDTFNIEYEDKEIVITRDNIEQYKFASLEVSDYDAYRCYIDKLPDDVYSTLDGTAALWQHEMTLFIQLIGSVHYMPAILIVLFIPFFFGRLFSDGTVKNLIASGHSKRRIYFASLLFTLVIDILMIILSLGVLAVFCAYYNWRPPVYLPVILSYILIEILVVFNVSAICIAALFISKKKVAAIIVGFVVAAFMFIPLMEFLFAVVFEDAYDVDTDSPEFQKYITIQQEEGSNDLQKRFIMSDFDVVYTYQGEDFSLVRNQKMPVGQKTFYFTQIYMDPYLVPHLQQFSIYPYMMYRDGPIAVNAANCLAWTTLITIAGYAVFKKREIA